MENDQLINDNQVVSLDYTIVDTDGNLIESSESTGPWEYVHGVGVMLGVLEQNLVGQGVGYTTKVTVAPEDGYGLYREDLVAQIPKEHFVGFEQITIGMEVQASTEEEEDPMVATVVGVDNDFVTLDANHPLSGMTIVFELTVRSVRPATPEEIEHGHVHSTEEECDHVH